MLTPIIAMPPKTNYSFDVIDNIGDSLLVLTDLHAPKRQLLMVCTKGMNRFTVKVPEYKETLQNAYWIGDRLIALYLKDVNYHAVVFDLTGKPVDYIPFPAGASVAGFAGSPQDTSTLVYCYSFTFPPIVFAYDLRQLKLTVFRKTTINYDYKQLETRQVFYSSRDGTRIPMILVHKKGLKRTEDHPTILYGYGGFGTVMTPFFDPAIVYLLEKGGVFALPSLRGGGEYGKDWHEAGRGSHKQNSIDDFISAAQFLIGEQYTTSGKLAIMGGSNGGLLVGAAMAQRPDLFRVAILQAPLLDMLRYQNFTIGHAWQQEYGSSADSLQFAT
jgi:prolyl oligopeptidase